MEPSNTTLPPTPPLPSRTLPRDARFLVACAVLGIPANAFTLWLTGWRLRGRGLAAFILSLAASDFLFLTNSLLQIWSVSHRHQWLLGTHLCRLHQFLYNWGYYSSLFLLATISLDRCLLVANPLWYRCRRPRRLPLGLCLGAWLLAAVCGLPDAALSSAMQIWGRVVCRSDRGDWEVPMRWLEVLVEGLVPFVVVVVCHVVALVLSRCRRAPGAHAPARFQQIVVVTLTLYVVLHLPFQVVQLLFLVGPWRVGPYLYVLGLAFNLYSCLNPYVYLLLGTRLYHHLARPLRVLLARRSPASVSPGPPTALNTVPPAPKSPMPAETNTPDPPTTLTPLSSATDAPEPPDTVSPEPPTTVGPAPTTTVGLEPPASTPAPPSGTPEPTNTLAHVPPDDCQPSTTATPLLSPL